MSYKLQFVPTALKEWKKLGETIRSQLKKKLAQRLASPHVNKDRLCGDKNLYKIKLRSSGYRLVYEVDEGKLVILVLGVGKRNRLDVYKKALSRVTES